jgi:hypothetical protein
MQMVSSHKAAESKSMPASYKIDKQKRLVVTCAWGTCTASDALEFRQQIVKDPDFDPGFDQLADFTAITSLDMTPDDVRMLSWSTPFASESRRALVVEDALAFAFSRIYESLRSLRGDQHVRVFRNRDDAMAWLAEED